MNGKPLSIIMPAYNRAKMLPRSIRSVLDQSHKHFEIIIVDDGSTDRTSKVIEEFKDPRIIYIYQNNEGRSAARNAGADRAAGEYLIFLDSDDEVSPHWLERLSKEKDGTKVGIVCCGAEFIIKRNGKVEVRKVYPKDTGTLSGNIKWLFVPGTFMIRRELFQAVGGYDRLLSQAENTELAWRLVPYCLANGWEVRAVQEILMTFHFDRELPTEKRTLEIHESLNRIINLHEHALRKYDPRGLSNFHAMAGVSAARLGARRSAVMHFVGAVKSYPWKLKHWLRLALAVTPWFGTRFWSGASSRNP